MTRPARRAPSGDAGNPDPSTIALPAPAAGSRAPSAHVDIDDWLTGFSQGIASGAAEVSDTITGLRQGVTLAATCSTCDGTGTIRDGHVDCPDCNGTGKMAVQTATSGYLQATPTGGDPPMRWTIRQTPDGTWELRHGDETVGTFGTAADAVAAIDAVAIESLAIGDGNPARFNMVMCVEGVGTGAGDDRYLNEGEGTWRTPPLALMFMDETQPGHMGASLAGRVDSVQRLSDGRRIFATGVYDQGDVGQEAARLVHDQTLRCVSVDIGPAQVEMQPLEIDARDGWPTRVLARFGPYEIMGATIVPFPALPLAVIWNDGDPVPDEVTADLPAPIPADQPPTLVNEDAAGADDGPSILDEIAILASAAQFAAGLPLADRDRAWDKSGADSRVRGWADVSDTPNAQYARAFFYVDPANKDKFGGYKLPFADVVDGKLVAVPRGIFAVAQRLDGTQIPDADKATIRSKVESYYAAMRTKFDDPSIVVPWGKSKSAAFVRAPGVLVASSVSVPARPPYAWFEDPQFDAPTRITITDAGEVFGHIAEWDCCHEAFTDRCIRPPRHPDGTYSEFLTGHVVTDDDRRVMTGRLVADWTHADERLDARAAIAHYDATSRALADLNVGEDQYGIWVHGALRPNVTEEDLRMLRASPPSGDWRGSQNHPLALKIVLATNDAGFPVRAMVASAGDMLVDDGDAVLSLVASAGRHLATNRFAAHSYQANGNGSCIVCGKGPIGHTGGEPSGNPMQAEVVLSTVDAEAAFLAVVEPVLARLDQIESAIRPLLPLAARTALDGVVAAVEPEPSPLERWFAAQDRTMTEGVTP